MEVATAFQRHFRPAKVGGVADHSTPTTRRAFLTSRPGVTGRRGDGSAPKSGSNKGERTHLSGHRYRSVIASDATFAIGENR
jgi:hypothetical protein